MYSFNSHLDGWYDVADQMRADIYRRADECFRQQKALKESLVTVADFEAHREKVRGHFLDSIGGLPTEKTPLRPQITGTVRQDGFRIEKILFESQPQYLVSANCYVPDHLEAPAPAVLFLCGHSANGKAYEPYQKVCRDLVRNGFIVLAIDPIGQGERIQYWRDGQPAHSRCTVEHTYAGIPFFLGGASVVRHFVWDAVRAIDYLESRADVDAARIGATGNSGGGMQTCFLMMVEPRLAAAAPATFPMTLESMLKSGQPQDLEQILPRCIERGPDHDDFLTALAPRPVLVGAAAYDAFPIEGTHEAVRRAQKIYELYGAGDKIRLAVDNALHCYSDGLRQACVNWFKHHLKMEAPDFVTGDPGALADEELYASPTGQIMRDLPLSASVTDLSDLHLATLPAPALALPARREMLDDVLGVSRSGDRNAPIFPRIEKVNSLKQGVNGTKIWFFSAPEIIVCGVLYSAQGTGGEALPTTILLHERGTAQSHEWRIEELLKQGHRVFVFDVRGVGGVASRTVSPLSATARTPFDTEYKLACDAAMLGISTLGLRVFDILRAFDYLASRPDIGAVSVYGSGIAAIWAFYAAALEIGFATVTCENRPASYRERGRNPSLDLDHCDLRSAAWGLLRCGDIEELLPLVSPRLVASRPTDRRAAPLTRTVLAEKQSAKPPQVEASRVNTPVPGSRPSARAALAER